MHLYDQVHHDQIRLLKSGFNKHLQLFRYGDNEFLNLQDTTYCLRYSYEIFRTKKNNEKLKLHLYI